MHGGKTRKAQERATEQKVRAQLARLDAPPVADPLTALSEIAGQVVAFKDAMADRVNKLTEIRYTDAKYAEQLRSEVALFERALDRCERFLSAMARLNIDERLARVSERQVEAVATALSAAIAELGLSEEQQREARSGVARHLRLVAG